MSDREQATPLRAFAAWVASYASERQLVGSGVIENATKALASPDLVADAARKLVAVLDRSQIVAPENWDADPADALDELRAALNGANDE